MAQIDFPLDEQCIYGDVWSSDEDDYTCATGNNSFNQGDLYIYLTVVSMLLVFKFPY